MSKVAFVFPGQGAQYIGMGKDIVQNFKSADMIFEKASDILGYNLKELVFSGSEELLKTTEITQPAILTTSMACLAALYNKGITKPDIVAGLSLGEYSAHVASATFSFDDAVSVTQKRGRYMQEAVPEGIGTMAAIIGLDNDIVIKCCNEAMVAGIVEPANFNCPGQVVIAGEVKAVKTAMDLCIEEGARRTVELPVSAPFHCRLLHNVEEKLCSEFDKISFKNPSIPVVANINSAIITDVDSVKDTLIRQVSNPVLWEHSIKVMIDRGINIFVEIGPGKVLSGFIRRINKDVTVLNVEDMQSLENTVEYLASLS